jgi:transcriptional regulator with XRE-family HTH domain
MPFTFHPGISLESAASERLSFSERLQQTLRQREHAPDSPTQLAREFNLRYEGKSVTAHAARKWLAGDAIPTQEKMRVLAQWLGVSAAWLRFGGPDAGANVPSNDDQSGRIKQKHLALIENLERLDDRHQQIVLSLVRQLALANPGK